MLGGLGMVNPNQEEKILSHNGKGVLECFGVVNPHQQFKESTVTVVQGCKRVLEWQLSHFKEKHGSFAF